MRLLCESRYPIANLLRWSVPMFDYGVVENSTLAVTQANQRPMMYVCTAAWPCWQLERVERAVGVSGDPEKRQAVGAALDSHLTDMLITEQVTTSDLLTEGHVTAAYRQQKGVIDKRGIRELSVR